MIVIVVGIIVAYVVAIVSVCQIWGRSGYMHLVPTWCTSCSLGTVLFCLASVVLQLQAMSSNRFVCFVCGRETASVSC